MKHVRLAKPAVVQPAASMFDFSIKADRKEAAVFLDTVWQGLAYLCEQVERVEQERGKSRKNFAYVDFGSSPGDAMVCNYFLWYANALSNFIGAFKKAFSPAENLKDEFANVITWRNKVAAHTAWVSPGKRKKKDNAVTQDMSIVLFPEFDFKFDGHFEVGGCRLVSPDKDKSSRFSGVPDKGESSPDWQWGLVRTHERLKEIVSKYAAATATATATPKPTTSPADTSQRIASTN
jgi:hypothetical protein